MSPPADRAPTAPRPLTPTEPDGADQDMPRIHRHGADIDWGLVSALRGQASDRLSAALGEDRGHLARPRSESAAERSSWTCSTTSTTSGSAPGRTPWSAAEQDAMAQAVFDSLFRLGRLQPLVDDDRVENIIIVGYDTVSARADRRPLVDGPPVADSDQELIDFLVFLASRSEVNARSFSEAQPRLHLRLDGGSRLAAAAWVTPRPSVVIRRHRLMQVTLDDLVDAGDDDAESAASFLRAAVRARKSHRRRRRPGRRQDDPGPRAVRRDRPRSEAIGTFETEYELHLHELETGTRSSIAWEARPGSGERGRDGRQAGEFTLDEALVDSFRFNLSRQIVGEVRGKEIWAMIKAMESGTGSISTTHAADAVAAVRKLVTCAMEAGPHVTHDWRPASSRRRVDLIVQLTWRPRPLADGAAQRAALGRRDHRRSTPASGRPATRPRTSSAPTRRHGGRPARAARRVPGARRSTASTSPEYLGAAARRAS